MAVKTRLDECLSIREGPSFVEECDANELARRFGTLIHVTSEDQLRRNARRYRSEFEQRWTDGTSSSRMSRPADVFVRDLVPQRLRGPR